MNRFPLLLVAAASVGWAAAPALADAASQSVRAGGVAVSVSAGDDCGDRPAAVAVEIAADEVHDPFIPDVYPSREDAARAAGAQWARQVTQRGQTLPCRVRVMCDDAALFAPVAAGVRTRLAKAAVDPCDGALCAGGPPLSGEAWLYVTLASGDAVSLRSAGTSDVVTARFVEKPWVANFPAFDARSSGRWVVAHSDPDRPAASASEAARQARVAAAEDVVPLVTARLHDARRHDRGEVRRLVQSHLLGDALVHDRFPQKFERPYGTLYRETILVNASDARLDGLAQQLRRSLESERQSRVAGVVSAGAILLVTYALYRFANAFTRGYFTWSLRTAAAVVAAGAVTLVVAAA